jgi:hypothetical protein
VGKTPVAKPTHFDKIARELTEAQAREICLYLIDRGEITLNQSGIYGKPPVPPGLDLKYQGKFEGLSVESSIGGVTFVSMNNKASKHITGPGWRMLVVAYRMAGWLTDGYGGGKIFHMGFKGSGGEENRHNRGLALDFAGAETTQGTWMVLDHWGKAPVPDSIGGKKGVWPAEASRTSYRLSSGDTGYDFFIKAYNFAAEQCRDGATGKVSAGTAGAPWLPGQNGYVIHPDYGGAGLRTAHQNHIHMDVGD